MAQIGEPMGQALQLHVGAIEALEVLFREGRVGKAEEDGPEENVGVGRGLGQGDAGLEPSDDIEGLVEVFFVVAPLGGE